MGLRSLTCQVRTALLPAQPKPPADGRRQLYKEMKVLQEQNLLPEKNQRGERGQEVHVPEHWSSAEDAELPSHAAGRRRQPGHAHYLNTRQEPCHGHIIHVTQDQQERAWKLCLHGGETLTLKLSLFSANLFPSRRAASRIS